MDSTPRPLPQGEREHAVARPEREWPKIVLLAVPALAWAGLLFWLSDQPGSAFKTAEAMSFAIPGRDYFAHGALYFVLGGLVWLWARVGLNASSRIALVVAVSFSVLYGVSDEWHQSFVPGRSPEALDVLADGLGALAASAVLWVASETWRRRYRRSPTGDENGG